MADDMQIQAVLSADASGMVNGFRQASNAASGLQKQLSPLSKLATVAGAAIGAAGFAAIKFGKDAFSAAARVSEMKVAMDAIGKSTGIGGKAIADAAKKIRDNGIEMAAAQKIAITYAQNNLDLARAADIARVGQDLAVISQRNSTDTAELLTRAIQTGNSVLLKSAGISRMAGEAYDTYAKKLGKSSTALSAQERQTAIMNLIMEEGEKVAGVYLAAMTEPGKVLRSFPRLYNDMQVAIGDTLLKGFGPLIKSSYDLTNAFSKTLREGGALYPVVQALGVVMKDAFKPFADGIKRLSIMVKNLDEMKFSVDGAAETINKFLPVLAALGTFLSMRVGKNILAAIPMFSKFAAGLNPIVGGIAVLVATSPRLRTAFMALGKAAAGLLPPLMKLAEVAADALTGIVETATDVIEVMVGPLTSAFNVAAGAIGLLAKNANILKPIIYAVGTAMMVNAVKGMFAASVAAGGLAARMLTLGSGFMAAGRNFSTYMGVLRLEGTTGFAAIRQAAAATGLSFKALGVAVASAAKAMLAYLAPLIIAFAAVKIIQAFGAAQRQVKERTKELNASLVENIAALKGNKEAILDYLTSVDKLGNDLLTTGEDGQKLAASLNALGIGTEDAAGAILQMKNATDGNNKAGREWMTQTLLNVGVGEDFASQIATAVQAHDDNGKMIRSLTYHYKQLYGTEAELPPLYKSMALAMEEYNDQAEKTNFTDLLKNRMLEIQALGKAEAQQAAKIDADVRAAAAAQGVTDKNEIAMRVLNALAEQMVIVATKTETVTEALNRLNRTSSLAANGLAPLWQRLQMLKLAEDETKFSTDQLAEAMFGLQKVKFANLQREIFSIRSSFTDLLENVEGGKGNMDVLVNATNTFQQQLVEAATNLKNLGKTNIEVAAAQSVLTQNFIDAAVKAGYQKEEVDKLLSALGILQNMRTVAIVDVDLSEAKKKLQEFITVMGGLAAAQGDAPTRMAFARLSALVSQLTDEKTRLSEATKTYTRVQKEENKASGEGGKAAEKLKKKMEDLREKIKETYEDGIAQLKENIDKIVAAQQDYMQSVSNAITSQATLGTAFQAVTAEAEENKAALERQKEATAQFAGEIASAISAVGSFTNILDGQRAAAEALNQATKKQSELQADVAEKQKIVTQLTMKYAATRSRAIRLDIFEDLKKAVTDLQDAQSKLADSGTAVSDAQKQSAATGESFLGGLELQVKKASEFAGKLKKLRDMNLSEAALKQIAAAGAAAGGEIADELIAGQADAIARTNQLTDSLAKLAEETGTDVATSYAQTGKTAAGSLLDAMQAEASRATEFAGKIKQLVQLGLSKENLQQVLNAGVTAGGQIADELLRGGKESVDRANFLQSQLQKAASDAASVAGGSYYDAGKNLAVEIYNGLVAKWNELAPKLPSMNLPQLQEAAKEATRTVNAAVEASNQAVNSVTQPTPITPTPPPQTPAEQMPDYSAAAYMALGQVASASQLRVKTRAEWVQEFLDMVNAQFRGLNATTLSQYYNKRGVAGMAPESARRARWEEFAQRNNVPALAEGGIVKASTGGTLALIGEGGRDEAVIPLPRGGMQGGNTYNITIQGVVGMDTQRVGRELVSILQEYERRNGRVPLKAGR